MAVKVFVNEGDDTGQDYDGYSVQVQDGHLMVIGGATTAQVVAAYAPGAWHHADVSE